MATMPSVGMGATRSSSDSQAQNNQAQQLRQRSSVAGGSRPPSGFLDFNFLLGGSSSSSASLHGSLDAGSAKSGNSLNNRFNSFFSKKVCGIFLFICEDNGI
jgi:hypothetical protein